jgi:hypothetical protein
VLTARHLLLVRLFFGEEVAGELRGYALAFAAITEEGGASGSRAARSRLANRRR